MNTERDELIAAQNNLVQRLKKDPVYINNSLSPFKVDLIHMALGIAGEAGELVDAVKKYTVYNKPLDEKNVVEELGDLLFYIRGVMQIIGYSEEEIIRFNLAKLKERYPTGYSDEAAQVRADKVGE